MNKTALITGATSGIGKACAVRFAQAGYHVIITGRRDERLGTLKKEIEAKTGVGILPLVMDIRKRKEVEKAIESLEEPWKNIDVLVNNAGLALGLDPVQDGDPEDWDTMIDTNIKGVLYITKIVARGMAGRGSGHIINIGSIAGKEVYPKGNVYCATKFAVDALTRGMRLDLLNHGIRVTQIAPGAVETEFSNVRFKGDNERAKKIYDGYQPLTGEDVAETVYFVTTLPPHVNINDLTVMPLAQANATHFNRK